MDVILLHDAAIDEYMSQLLLQTIPGINLLGVVIVNADCIDSAAMQTAWQVQSYVGNPNLPMGLSGARGWNPLPWQYRSDCVKMSQIAALKDFPPNPNWPPFPDGDALLADLLDICAPGVTMLVTCPFTPLTTLLAHRPDLKSKIGRIVWMGGAIKVPATSIRAPFRPRPGMPARSGTRSGILRRSTGCFVRPRFRSSTSRSTSPMTCRSHPAS